jgi:hypothetical protein
MRENSTMTKRIPAALVLALLCMAGSSCMMLARKDPDPALMVKESQLNWLEIRYLPGMGQPAVLLSLQGSGHIQIKRGGSPLVSNDFSQDIANVKWNDLQVDQLTLTPAEMRGIFQALVDRGLLREPDKDFMASVTRGVPAARIVGTLNTEHVARIAIEPELAGYIRSLLKLFDENKPATEATK